MSERAREKEREREYLQLTFIYLLLRDLANEVFFREVYIKPEGVSFKFAINI